MKVINEVKVPNYEQWLAGFVKRIMKKAKIECKEVRVTSLDEKFVHISVDGDMSKYIIMIDGYRWIDGDQNGLPCAAKLQYVLFEMNEEGYMGILTGEYKVSWINKYEEWFPKDAIESLAWSVLEEADVYTEEISDEDEEIKFYENNCIVVRVKEDDYVIQVTSFPAIEFDEENIPIRFKVTYILRKVSYDKETGVGHMTDVKTGECELCWDDEFEEYYIDSKVAQEDIDWYLSVLEKAGLSTPEGVTVALM